MGVHGRLEIAAHRSLKPLDAAAGGASRPEILGDGRRTMDLVHIRDAAPARPQHGGATGLPEFAGERSVDPVPRRLATSAREEGFLASSPKSRWMAASRSW